MNRVDTIAEVANQIKLIDLPYPLRVAVDGRTASGKTTFVSELTTALKGLGRTVISTTIDGFHNPKIIRYERGRYSAEGYYRDARDLAAIRTLLLDPLGPNGSLAYRTASFDLEKDQAIEQVVRRASKDAVLIVDGTFLQRPELIDAWDVIIFLDTTELTSEARGVARDTKALGGVEMATRLYSERYKPAYAIYLTESQPENSADVVIENNNFEAPIIHLRKDGRLVQ